MVEANGANQVRMDQLMQLRDDCCESHGANRHEVFGFVHCSRELIEGMRWVEFGVKPSASQFREYTITGLALDASGSMRRNYGRTTDVKIPRQLLDEYREKGWIRDEEADGERKPILGSEAIADAKRRGYYKTREYQNIVSDVAEEIIGYLSTSLSAYRSTEVIYWACREGKDGVHPIGDMTARIDNELRVKGPPGAIGFGQKTYLEPAFRYFLEKLKNTEDKIKLGLFVFITDGKIDDGLLVGTLTQHFAQNAVTNRGKRAKCVLIGVGNNCEEDEVKALDNLKVGVDWDTWDYMHTDEWGNVSNIVRELVSPVRIAQRGVTVVDDSNAPVLDVHTMNPCDLSAGLPEHLQFFVSPTAKAFVLRMGNTEIRQELPLR